MEKEENKIPCIRIGYGGESYLVPLNLLEKVQAGPVIIPVPDAPEHVSGISIYQGEVIPYLNLTGDRRADREMRCGILIRSEGGDIIGVAADEVGELTEAAHEELEAQADRVKNGYGGSSSDQAFR